MTTGNKTEISSATAKSARFSLVELLVVIAIISLLMSVLLPALARVKAKGKQISCAGNEKQLAISLMSYADDYNSYMPNNSKTTASPDLIWPWLLKCGGYLGDTMLYYCAENATYTPTYSHEYRIHPNTSWTYYYVSYGINAVGVTDDWYASGGMANAQEDITPAIPASVKNPSEKVLLADAHSKAATDRPFFILDAAGMNGAIISRHSSQANVSWVDGHVSSVANGKALQLNPLLSTHFKRD